MQRSPLLETRRSIIDADDPSINRVENDKQNDVSNIDTVTSDCGAASSITDGDNERLAPMQRLDTGVTAINKPTDIDKYRMIKGIISMLLSACLISIVIVLTKYGSNYGYSSSEMLMIRGIVQSSIVLLVLFFKYIGCIGNYNNRDEFKKTIIDKMSKSTIGWLFLRGICGSGAAIMYYYAVTIIPIGDAVATFSLYPITTAFVGYFCLNEKLIRLHGVALICAIFGAILLSQPHFIFNSNNNDSNNNNDNKKHNHDDDDTNMIGYGVCIIAAILVGFAFVALRKLPKMDKNIFVLSFGFSCFVLGLIFSFIINPKGIKFPNYNQVINSVISRKRFYCECGILFGSGLIGYISNLSITYGAQRMQSSLSSLLRSTDTIYTYIFQIVLFNQIPTLTTIMGALLVVISVIMASYAKYKQNQSKSSELIDIDCKNTK